MEYDVNFGTLVRRQTNYLIDGIPLVAGIACLLHQVWSSCALSYVNLTRILIHPNTNVCSFLKVCYQSRLKHISFFAL